MRILPAGVIALALASGCTMPRDVVSRPLQPAETAVVETGTEFASATPSVIAGGPVDRAKTLAYWKRVKEVAERKPSDDLDELPGEYRRAAREIRARAAVGVDGELLAHAENVARRLERFASLGEFTNKHSAEARRIERTPNTILQTGMEVHDAISQLKGLRAKLSQRHGLEFPAIEQPM